jgi:hypothetical protein
MGKETVKPTARAIVFVLPALLVFSIGIATAQDAARKKEQEQQRAAQERQRQAEQQRQREAQERQRQQEMQRQAQERQRQADQQRLVEQQRQREAQERQRQAEQQRQMESQRQAEQQRQREAQDRQRQAEHQRQVEMQRQAEQQRQREAQERQRQADQQRQRESQDRLRQATPTQPAQPPVRQAAPIQPVPAQPAQPAARQVATPQPAVPAQPAARQGVQTQPVQTQTPQPAVRQVVAPSSPTPQSPGGFATPGVAPAARPVAAATPTQVGYAPAPTAASMPRYVESVNNCVHSQSHDGRFVLTNQCREGIRVMYCVRPDNEPARCTAASQMSFRTLEPKATLQESTRTAARINWLACRDGYKPEFAEWTGNTLRGRCVLGDDISLLRDWRPMATSAYGGSPVVDVCINDTQCEDGDILAVSVNGREVMREEIFNRPSCKRVPVNSGHNVISIYAVNGTGYKGNCSFTNRNTGQIAVHPVDARGQRENPQSQSWSVPGGAGSSSSMVVTVR